MAERNMLAIDLGASSGRGIIGAYDGKTLRLDRLPEGETKTYAERVSRDYGIYKILWRPDVSSGRASDRNNGIAVRICAG